MSRTEEEEIKQHHETTEVSLTLNVVTVEEDQKWTIDEDKKVTVDEDKKMTVDEDKKVTVDEDKKLVEELEKSNMTHITVNTTIPDSETEDHINNEPVEIQQTVIYIQRELVTGLASHGEIQAKESVCLSISKEAEKSREIVNEKQRVSPTSALITTTPKTKT